MQPAFPFVDISTPVDLLATMITPQNPAVLVRDFKTDKTFIITRCDVIRVSVRSDHLVTRSSGSSKIHLVRLALNEHR